MSTDKYEYLRKLADSWRRASMSGFMPDEKGNKIAVTRTNRCAEELDTLVTALEILEKVER